MAATAANNDSGKGNNKQQQAQHPAATRDTPLPLVQKKLAEDSITHAPASSNYNKKRKRRSTRAMANSGFDPSNVNINVRITWCDDNTNFCQNVCLNKTWGAPINDHCDPSSLNWHCTCGNGKNPSPDIYTFPVMHYVCQHEVYQCQNSCATGDLRCTQECQSDKNCTAPNDPNAGKTAAPESDAEETGLDTDGMNGDPVNFFSAASMFSVGGYMALTAIVAASIQMLGLP